MFLTIILIIAGLVIIGGIVFFCLAMSADNTHAKREEIAKSISVDEFEERKKKYGEEPIRAELSLYNFYEIYQGNKFIYLNYNGKIYEIHFNELVESALHDNGSFSYSQGKVTSNLKSTVGRAVVGGAIAGGAGAIIGGTTGKKTTSTSGYTNVYHILSVTLNSIQNPTIIIDEQNLRFTPVVNELGFVNELKDTFAYMQDLNARLNLIIRNNPKE